MKQCKRILSLALALVMILGLLPAAALAAEPGGAAEPKAPDTVTITFNAHGYGTAPDPVEIPYGSSLWDSVYDLNSLRMENTDGMIFWGWGTAATDRRDDRLSWDHPFYEDTTLYAVWQKELNDVTLYVDQPIVLDPIDKPNTSVTSEYSFAPESLGWWDSANGYWNGDAPLTGKFQPGKTYYGVVKLEPDLYSSFAEGIDVVSVIGAKKVREDRVEATEEHFNDGAVLYVTFSLTVPKRDVIDEIDILVDIGWSGWLWYGTPPTQLCLTPGVGLAEGSWWENLEDVGDESKAITGNFPTGCPVYTAANLWPSLNCSIDFENLTVNIEGGTLIRTGHTASGGGVQVVYSVWSPDYHGMEFFTQGSGWIFIGDNPHARRWHEGPFYETGTYTVTALPDPGWRFVAWYEGWNADVLVSTDLVYTFENEPGDDLLCLTAVFAEGILPIETVEIEVPIPAAGDSFNWETDSAGAVVTNGAHVKITRDAWYNEWGISGAPLPFEEGQNYFVEIDLQAEPGYEITDSTVFRINGEPAAWKQQSNVVTWSISSRNYTMTAPIEIKLVEIEVPIPVAGDSFWSETDSAGAVVTNGAPVNITKDKWYAEGGVGGSPLIFEEYHFYFAEFEVTAQPGYKITDSTVFMVNGEMARWWDQLNEDTWAFTSQDYEPIRKVSEVEVYVNTPVGYSSPDVEPYVPEYEAYEVTSFFWSDENGTELTMPFEFEPNKPYTITVSLAAKEDCIFADDVTARMFWDEAEILSHDAHQMTIRATRVSDPGFPNPFVDVEKGKYYYEPVMWAYYHDPQITAGSDDTHFSPNKDCTRAQVVTFLWRANGCPEPTITEHSFTDVKESAYYYKAMLWAVETGITTGATSTTFAPNKACTRAQVVTFLWRAKGSPEPSTTTCPFTDVKTSSGYYKAILWAVEEGVTTGTSDTTFSPNNTCSRGHVVTFLYRVYGPKG